MKTVVLGGISATSLLLGLAFVLAGQWLPAALVLGVGTLWGLHVWLKWADLSGLWFTLFTAGAAWGVWLEAPTIVILLGAAAVLITWDLARFSHRLSQPALVHRPKALYTPHLRRLSIVAATGLFLGGVATEIELNLTFGWAVLLTFLMTISLSLAVIILRRSNP